MLVDVNYWGSDGIMHTHVLFVDVWGDGLQHMMQYIVGLEARKCHGITATATPANETLVIYEDGGLTPAGNTLFNA